MHLFLLGVSHRTAPVELREKLDFSSRDVGAAVEALATRSSAAESVVLSTCNRSEIYVASESLGAAHDEIVEFLCDYHQLPPDSFTAHLFSFSEAEVASHLFRVAAGLDSLVVGEPQILGQVKDAFQTALERHCTGPTAFSARLSASDSRTWPRISASPGTSESRPAATRKRCISARSPR